MEMFAKCLVPDIVLYHWQSAKLRDLFALREQRRLELIAPDMTK